ncbi:MAG: hypothetical protein ABMA02_10780 [Saprospiraceae bacterium]
MDIDLRGFKNLEGLGTCEKNAQYGFPQPETFQPETLQPETL